MDIRQLRYFTNIVECRSFSKAAGQLHVAQPALSQHVRHMERELGMPLLHRGSKGIIATEAGERLFFQAKRILAQFAELPDHVRGKQATLRGDVRVGLPGTVTDLLAKPLIETAKLRYPGLRIRVVEAMTHHIIEWLQRGDVDLAMIYNPTEMRGIAMHHGLSEEVCLFASPSMEGIEDHPGPTMAFADAVRLPLIAPGPGHGLRDLLDAVALSVGVTLKPTFEIDSYSQTKTLTARGLGYGVLPRMTIQKDIEAGSVRAWRFAGPGITRKLYLAYSTERPLFGAPRAIGQLCWETLRQLVGDAVWAAELQDGAQDLAFVS
jgi:LysR family nitrogen assimilation transcriptional regulator